MRNLLDQSQRKGLATALYSLGNIVAAALVIGQFVGTAAFRLEIFLAGVAIFLGLFAFATDLNQEEKGL